MPHPNSSLTAEQLNAGAAEFLPDQLGMRLTAVGDGWTEGEMEVRKPLMAPNGFLHAASVIALADSLAGLGCVRSLPDGATGFTTIELKSNFLGTARDGWLEGRASAAHLGRTTQIWDAEIKHRESGKTIALFRCTQMVLWPR